MINLIAIFYNFIVPLSLWGAAMYGFALFVRFTRLAIEALSIYIDKNKS